MTHFKSQQAMCRHLFVTALVVVTCAILPNPVKAAGTACWWNGATACRVTNASGTANLCRTPSRDTCRLAWDRDQAIPNNVLVLAGIVYEVSSPPQGPLGVGLHVDGSFVESELRMRVAKTLRVAVASLERKSAWFYLVDEKSEGAFDRERVAGTDLCVAVAPSLGTTRLQLSHCSPTTAGHLW